MDGSSLLLPDQPDDPAVCSISNPEFVIYSSVVSFYLPFIVTLLVYIRIYVFLRMRRKRIAFRQASAKVRPDPPICGPAHLWSANQRWPSRPREF